MIARIKNWYRGYVAAVEALLRALEKLLSKLVKPLERLIPTFEVPDRVVLALSLTVCLSLFLYGLWAVVTTVLEAYDSGAGLFGPTHLPRGRPGHVWLLLVEQALLLVLGTAGLNMIRRARLNPPNAEYRRHRRR